MLFKAFGIEVRTGKDRNHYPPKRPAVEEPIDVSALKSTLLLSGPTSEPKMNQQEWAQATQGQSQSLSLVGRRPHAFTKAIQWPAIPDDPLGQTYLSIFMNETDRWFRELQKINISLLREYLERENIILYGKAREAFDILRSLHCVPFHQIHPAVLKSTPAMYSCILSGGEDNFDYGSGWK